MRLQDRVAIITGAARGSGQKTAEVFCQEGATVIIWDVLGEGQTTAQTLSDQGYRCEFMYSNMTEVSAIEAAARDINERYGRIDILINNAGITRWLPTKPRSSTDMCWR